MVPVGCAVVMRLLALAVAVLLAGCAPAERAADNVTDVVEEASQAASDPVQDAQNAVAEASAPVIEAVQEAAAVVAEVLPEPAPKAGSDPRLVRHIVRWEVTSEKRYTKALQGIICPGGASGPTWGIGYDGGHQSESTIRSDWAMRPDVDRLATTAGQAGPGRCAASKKALSDIRVPFKQATDVLGGVSLPVWVNATRRAYPGLADIGGGIEVALTGNAYNRGLSMAGSRNAERRTIRDKCIPQRDVGCVAANLRGQCRLWEGTPNGPGLCARRNDEASEAEKS